MRHDDVTAATSAPPIDLDGFVRNDYARVVAAVGLVTGDRGRAEDAVQDAVAGLLARPPEEPLRSVAAWVTVVASNHAKSGMRRRGAEGRALERLSNRAGASTADRTHVEHSTVDHGDVIDAINTLSPQQREVCVMHYYLDASVADIATALGVSDGTVKTQLHRARQNLAQLLGADDAKEGRTDG